MRGSVHIHINGEDHIVISKKVTNIEQLLIKICECF